MAQQTPTQPSFNYAGLEPMGGFLPLLKLEEGKQALVSFLEEIPGMNNPPFVYCKIHWNSEMGDNGRMFQCFGGSCCEQVTWQKGWNGEPGKFDVNKARTRYYVPIVHYEPNPSNPAESIATAKYLDLTYTAYDALIKTVQNTNEGLSFFDRDITLEVTKVNGATNYLYHKKESKAMWKTNPTFKEQVESQLPDFATKLLASMPKTFTEAEFLAMKPAMDAKVHAAMASQSTINQASAQAGFGALPGAQAPGLPPNPPAAPAVNLPPIPQAQPAQDISTPQIAEQVVTPSVVTEIPQPAATPAFEVPQVSLDFDPSQILK